MKIILTAFVILALLFFLGNYTSTQEPTYTIKAITIEPGNTLWTLGEKYAPKSNLNEWIHKVTEMNHLGTFLIPGQIITILEEN